MNPLRPLESAVRPTPPAPGDLMLVGMLKALWTQYGHLPQVRQSFRLALNDGSVDPRELDAIKASIALALAHEMGGWGAFVATKPDPKLLAELEGALRMAQNNPEVSATVHEILQDGQVSEAEMKRLRQVLSDAVQLESRGPATRVRQPPPPRPDMPGRLPTKEDEDDGD